MSITYHELKKVLPAEVQSVKCVADAERQV